MKTIRSLQVLFRKSTYKTISLHASCAGYYMLLSFLPMLVVFYSLICLLQLPEKTVWNMLQISIPQPLIGLIAPLLQLTDAVPSVPVISVSAATWLWTSSKGISALIEGMNAVLRHQTQQSFLKRRLTSILLLFLLSVGFILTTRILTSIAVLPGFILTFLKHRTISSLFLLTVLFSIVYQFHSNPAHPFRYSLLGGLVSALGWIVISYVFSIYALYFAEHYHVFGKIGILLLFAVWLRACMILLFCGIKYAHIRAAGYHSAISYILRLLENIHE